MCATILLQATLRLTGPLLCRSTKIGQNRRKRTRQITPTMRAAHAAANLRSERVSVVVESSIARLRTASMPQATRAGGEMVHTGTSHSLEVRCARVDRGYGPINVRFTSNSDRIDASQRNAALCQKRTHAPQHTVSLFDHAVGA